MSSSSGAEGELSSAQLVAGADWVAVSPTPPAGPDVIAAAPEADYLAPEFGGPRRGLRSRRQAPYKCKN